LKQALILTPAAVHGGGWFVNGAKYFLNLSVYNLMKRLLKK
jgi:hypothetical protein